MAKGIMRVKAKALEGMTRVKLMAKHPMHNGQQVDTKSGEAITAQYLRELKVMYEGRDVFVANMGVGMSTNPFFSFAFAGGEKGTELTMIWVENTGETATEVVKIK